MLLNHRRMIRLKLRQWFLEYQMKANHDKHYRLNSGKNRVSMKGF